MSIGGVVAYESVVRTTGVAELLARPTQYAAVPVAGYGVAVREAGGVAQDASLAVTDRGYFYFLISLGGCCIVPIQPTDLEGHLWNYRGTFFEGDDFAAPSHDRMGGSGETLMDNMA